MSAPETLSRDQLEELKSLWQAQGAPVAANLRPGLSDAEIDELMEPLDLELPAEARLWWGWHDGADLRPSRRSMNRMFGPRLQFLSLEKAAQAYKRGREIREKAHGDSAEQYWRPEWFPLTVASGEVVCDCSVAPGEPTQIRVLDPQLTPDAVKEVIARSLGELVGWWCEALDTGAWHHNPDRGVWDYDFDLLGFPDRRSWVV